MCEWYAARSDAAIIFTKHTTASVGLHVLTSAGALQHHSADVGVASDVKFHVLLRTIVRLMETAGARMSVQHVAEFLGDKLETIAPVYSTATTTEVDSRAEAILYVTYDPVNALCCIGKALRRIAWLRFDAAMHWYSTVAVRVAAFRRCDALVLRCVE